MNGTTWTAFETEGAVYLRAQGCPASKIAFKLHKTKNAVLGKFNRLGLAEKGKDPHWSPEKRAKFKRMWLDGLPAGHIGRDMGMKPTTVYGRRVRMGLPGRKETNGSRVVTLP